MAFSYDDARLFLKSQGQEHLLRFWKRLNNRQKAGLLRQIETLDFTSIERMRGLLHRHAAGTAAAAIEPAPVVVMTAAQRRTNRAIGEQHLRDGCVGVLLVAGGQGSRLGFDGPKGILPLAPITQASLFSIHARKVLALERRYGVHVPLYIMTSESNDGATREFFARQKYFGLSPRRVMFFVQGMWPSLLPNGRIILDRPDHIFMSPDGHGGILAALRVNGMLDDMRARGLQTLFFFQVDNPLVEIADPAFIGLHCRRKADMSVKVCAKRDPNEGLGVVALRDGRNAVVEYTELTTEQKEATTPDGRLKFLFGSVAIHVFSLDFLCQEARAQLPIHVAHKKVPVLDDKGRLVKPDHPNAYKFEKFIFDVVPDAKTVANVAFAREDEFSPVKNATGVDSPGMARRDMMRKFARWLEACGVRVPRTPEGEPAHKIEIDPCFAAGAEDLQGKLEPGIEIAGDLLLGGRRRRRLGP
jgi:UDP-N-acetylglucosamine/UDP-N-acetylgalactosamine diphosphorylase